MSTQTIVAIIALIVSGITSFTSLFLTFLTVREANKLAKASRRTLALNCLSDERLALLRVRTECESLHLLIRSSLDKLGDNKDHLLSETNRILEESRMMLANLENKRSSIESKLSSLSAADIEEIIAASYQGKILAEGQLSRTARSREDTIRLYL
jgi:biopolymer transport protein ExbB/TolQ